MDKLSAIDAFIKVAKMDSFTAASAQLSISPSAVTKSVSQLEKHLGVRLLNRTPRARSFVDFLEQLFKPLSRPSKLR